MLVVHREQDRVVQMLNWRRVVDAIPGAKLAVMDNYGLVPHEGDPYRFAQIVSESMNQTGLEMLDA